MLFSCICDVLVQVEHVQVCDVLVQAEREKIESEELVSKASVEMTSLDRTLVRLEAENFELRQLVQTLQARLSQVENDHTHR